MSIDTPLKTMPDGWKTSTIGEVCKVVSGSTPKTNVSEYWGGDIPWLTPNDLSKNRSKVVNKGERSITQKGFESCSTQMVPEGSVLFTSRAPIGYVAIAGTPMCTNQGFKSAIPSEDIGTEFLYWQLQYLTDDIRSRASGTTFLEISGRGFAATNIVLPTLKEQEKIVEVLEEQISRLDAAIVSVRAVRKKAARFRRSLLHAAFTGALTDSYLSEGEIPDGWRKSTIAEVANVAGGRTPTKFEERLADSEMPNRIVPFYKVGDMNSSMRFLSQSRVYFSESEASDFGIEILKAGTVIFPKAGGAIATNKKRILELPGAIDLNCMGVTANGLLNEKLLYWFFESFNLSSIADGTVLPQINKKKVCALEIAFPIGADKQAKLLDEIEAEISKSDAVVQVVDNAEKKVSALRRSLLHAAFTGELTKEWREGAYV